MTDPQFESACDTVVIFAGGAHTLNRVDAARPHMTSPQTARVYLTGHEFVTGDEDLAPGLAFELQDEFQGVELRCDLTRTTLESCLLLCVTMGHEHDREREVVVVTSNYHSARVAWMLKPLLAEIPKLSVVGSPEMTLRRWMRDSMYRRLAFGECMSWLYCFPVGLVFRLYPRRARVGLARSILNLVHPNVRFDSPDRLE